MTRDINKGIEHIEYNFLNLPKTIEFENGDYIIYYYDASGIKLRKEIYHNNELITNIDYICNTVYKNNKLDFIITEEGRIKKLENNTLRNEYYIKDIPIAIGIGNVRVCFTDTYDDVHNRKVKLLQTNAYYPFGMTMTLGNNDNKYKYNGKELQDDFGLEWYDYRERFYDAQLGRWHVVDPMASNAPGWSPYRAFYCNPINFTDPTGMLEDWVQNKETNEYEWKDDVTSADNTPESYRYVGPDDKDILPDLNLPSKFSTKTDSRTSFGLDGDNRSGAPIGTKANVSGNIKVNADVVYDKDNISDNNVSGKTFKGVTFKASFKQSSKSPSSDLTMKYKGYFGVQYGDKTYSSFLKKPTGTYIYETGTNPLQAKISISSSNMNNLKVFKSAYISVGVTNHFLFISPKPIKLSWNLMRNPVFLPKQ